MFQVRATRLRKILVELGPTYIKIVQAISFHADFIPPSYLDEFSLLQDRISPFSTKVAFNMIEQELGLSLVELFSEISPEPIAAASLRYVYQARLCKTGPVVAIKVHVLLTGHLKNVKQAVGVLAIVLNFDYSIFLVMLSLATCVSTRVSNELGVNQASLAYRSAYASLTLGFVFGCIGNLVMVATKGIWRPLFSHDRVNIKGVKKTMLLMALEEVFNFPLIVCGGIV